MQKSLFKIAYLIHLYSGDTLDCQTVSWKDQAKYVDQMIVEDKTLIDSKTISDKGDSILEGIINLYKK